MYFTPVPRSSHKVGFSASWVEVSENPVLRALQEGNDYFRVADNPRGIHKSRGSMSDSGCTRQLRAELPVCP